MRSCGTSSRYCPPKEWLLPVLKFVNDIRCVPPTLASSWWTLPVKPFGGSHLAKASGSRNARYTRSGVARSTRCSRMVFPAIVFSFIGVPPYTRLLPSTGLPQPHLAAMGGGLLVCVPSLYLWFAPPVMAEYSDRVATPPLHANERTCPAP